MWCLDLLADCILVRPLWDSKLWLFRSNDKDEDDVETWPVREGTLGTLMTLGMLGARIRFGMLLRSLSEKVRQCTHIKHKYYYSEYMKTNLIKSLKKWNYIYFFLFYNYCFYGRRVLESTCIRAHTHTDTHTFTHTVTHTVTHTHTHTHTHTLWHTHTHTLWHTHTHTHCDTHTHTDTHTLTHTVTHTHTHTVTHTQGHTRTHTHSHTLTHTHTHTHTHCDTHTHTQTP